MNYYSNVDMKGIQDNTYTVITGAAEGLGRAFAIELSERKMNTILIDVSKKKLAALSYYLKLNYKVQSEAICADLTDINQLKTISHDINEKYKISLLINNAGAGGTKRMEDASMAYINKIIQLNVMATSVLTHQLLPNLRQRDKAYVLNVSSMAAFSPIGYKTVYPASKAFIQSFSRGLSQELKQTNVFVSVVNPGPMKTNKDVTDRINKQGFLGKIGLLSPEKVAEISIRQLFKRDSLIILNKMNAFNWILTKILPMAVKLPLLTKAVYREIKMKEAV